ncbi:30S ribosomal protein S1 [Bdellovibrionota bacterium]
MTDKKDLSVKIIDEGKTFKELFEESLKIANPKEGEVLAGKVIHVTESAVTIDVGYKSEGQVSIEEFKGEVPSIGDEIDVYLDRIENENGLMILSREKAEILKAWDEISKAVENDELVEGKIIAKVKGGLSVDIGVKAFLPGSQVDLRPVRYLEDFVGKVFQFKIIKFNKKRGNIVLSRRALLEKEREHLKDKTLAELQEGMTVEGTVKNITEYGAFIDLGGVDGLLHITDMSWGRIKHPSEMLRIGESIKVRVLKYDPDRERVSLGLKQETPDPWSSVAARYNVGDRVKGEVVSLTDYGAFVEIEEGIEGLIHVSEMSWIKRVKHPSKMVNIGDHVEAVVLDVDASNHRISLGMKQIEPNPWELLATKYPVGTRVKGAVKNVTDFGVFIGMEEGIDGMVHVSDISWTEKIDKLTDMFNKGDEIEAAVLDIDQENQRFSLGIKQLERDPWEEIEERFAPGKRIKCKVTKLTEFGAFVELEQGVEGLIHVSEFSKERVEHPKDVVSVGDEIDAMVTNLDRKERRIALSVKAMDSKDERSAMREYKKKAARSSKSSLGDILKEKLAKKLMKKSEEPKAEEPKAEEPKAEEPKAEESKAEEPKAEESKESDDSDEKKE